MHAAYRNRFSNAVAVNRSQCFLQISKNKDQSLYTKDATKEDHTACHITRFSRPSDRPDGWPVPIYERCNKRGHTACHVTRFSRSLDRPDGWLDLASLSHFKEKPLSCTNSTRSPWPFSLNFADKPSEFSKIAKQSRPTTLPTRAWLGLNEPNSAKL
jgi:hypothetical protein